MRRVTAAHAQLRESSAAASLGGLLILPLLLPLPRVYLCLCFGLLFTLATDSRADAVLLRFAPSSSGGVAGYKVYFAPQSSGPITSAPVDIGSPVPDSTGVASYTLSGLNPKVAYSFELTSYDSKGAQSAHSNRLNLAARNEVLGDVLWSNNFSVYAPGVHVPGFVDSRGDSRTTTGTDLFEVAYFGNNDPAFGSGASDGLVSTRYLGSGSLGWSSYEVAGRVWTSGTNAAAGIGLHATEISGSGPDQAFVFGQSASGSWLLFGYNEPALTCASSPSTGVSQPATTWYSFRVRVTRASGLTRLRAMVWPRGGAAPAGWQVDCWTTLSAPADSGAFGLRRGRSGSAYFDDLSVTAVIGQLDPIPPQ